VISVYKLLKWALAQPKGAVVYVSDDGVDLVCEESDSYLHVGTEPEEVE